jgi:hypothetical protein
MLLLLDANAQVDAANSLIQNNSSFCRDIDPATTAYLISREIICPSQQVGSNIQLNLNRPSLLALWSQNEPFRQFIERLAGNAKRVSEEPPLFEFSREVMRLALRTTQTSEA